MKNTLLKLITPFKGLTQLEKILSTTALILLLIILWSFSGSKYLPAPLEIVSAIPHLLNERDLVGNFGHSLWFCFKAIGYSTLISLVFCYISVLPLFASLCEFLRKFRFLPSAGLTFLFLKIANGVVNTEMTYLMVFGVTTWLLDSMVGIALAITQDEVMYSKSLRLNRWQMMREILIYGKAASIFGAVISNFAMAWMLLASIESIAKANGGIGVILSQSASLYRYDEVYATQILILMTGISIDALLRLIRGWAFPYTKLSEAK